jgi:2-isopropylmalate synthase/UPF0716 protein FxsA
MIYFLIYIFLETMISVWIAGRIGGLNTFLEIIFTALLGIYIIKSAKENLFSTLTELMFQQINSRQFINLNLYPLIGAVLLIVPGFFTDLIGIILQILPHFDFGNSDEVEDKFDFRNDKNEDNKLS